MGATSAIPLLPLSPRQALAEAHDDPLAGSTEAQPEVEDSATEHPGPATASEVDAAPPAESTPQVEDLPALATSADVTGELEIVRQDTVAVADAAQPEEEPAPEGRRRWTRKRTAIAAIGAALVICGATLAAVVATRSPSAAALASALTSANRDTERVAITLSAADSMAEVQLAARAAAAAEADARARLPKLRSSGTKKQRDAVVAAIAAHAEYLQAVSQLGRADESKLKEWPTMKAGLDERVRSLQRAQTSLSLLGDARLSAIPVAKAEESVHAVDAWAVGALRKLEEWQAAADRVAAEKAAQLAALAQYETAFRPLVQQYTGLRNDMQDFINRVDASGATYTEAFAFLASASAERSRVRNSMKALVPPAPMAAAQNGVVQVVDRAIDAVNAASEGVRQHQLASYYYASYYKDAPGWREFQRASSAITRQYDGALQAWEAALTTEKNRINAIAPPERPTI